MLTNCIHIAYIHHIPYTSRREDNTGVHPLLLKKFGGYFNIYIYTCIEQAKNNSTDD